MYKDIGYKLNLKFIILWSIKNLVQIQKRIRIFENLDSNFNLQCRMFKQFEERQKWISDLEILRIIVCRRLYAHKDY